MLVLFSLAFSPVLFSQRLAYTNANDGWNADSLGNHRAVVVLTGHPTVARVIIEWRRRDSFPERKRIFVQDAATGDIVRAVQPVKLSRESGTIYFQPRPGHATYFIYYMPYKNEGRSNYPKGVYLAADTAADQPWLSAKDTIGLRPNTFCRRIEAINAFNSFYPMEVIATAKETASLLSRHREEYFLVFPEDRMHVIKMKHDLPQRWIAKGERLRFAGLADRGENFAFQLGIYALSDLDGLMVSTSGLTDAAGHRIDASAFSCINTGGRSYNGLLFAKNVQVAAGTIQPLWCNLLIPEHAFPGEYHGYVTLKEGRTPEKKILLSIQVSNKNSINHGADQPELMTRLSWLNSDLAQQNEVIAPYTALVREGSSISLLGRKIELNKDGLPKQIQTFFSPEMTGLTEQPNNLLTEPVHFHFTLAGDGKDIKLTSRGVRFTRQEAGTMAWTALNENDSLEVLVAASLEFDGFMNCSVKVTAKAALDFKDITLHLPFRPEAATYVMGLGQKGGLRPDTVQWKWDVAHKNQDGAWIGAVNAGLQYSLRDENYSRPLNTNFFLQKPLLLPASWGNEGRGGIDIFRKGASVLASNYSGSRSMKKGDTLFYNFTLLVTPFHAINTDFQWKNRFYHRYNSPDSIKAAGATVVNIHHATPINPWINYPFIAWKKMKAYIDSAHQLGLKVKIYNTIRELSDHAWETFALRSLDHEIYSPGKGGGFSWLQEHLGDDYIPAWFVPELNDAAIINSGLNRWHNYYVEGMNWLVQRVGIDGIYLDDVAFDRITMKRIKRVLTQGGHPGIIDLHSANQYNKNDGFNNSAMLYMEHFPYLNRLWFGEYFDYENNSPDYFLTEVSGIPFGLMGEMLQGDGNPWRGMLYGMTSRLGWSDKSDPRPFWKLWDEVGMQGIKMVGYWSPRCPVTTGDKDILATVFAKKGTALVALASWAAADKKVNLQIDWNGLGLDRARSTITAPEIAGFQPGRTFREGEPIPVSKNKGWLLLIQEK